MFSLSQQLHCITEITLHTIFTPYYALYTVVRGHEHTYESVVICLFLET